MPRTKEKPKREPRQKRLPGHELPTIPELDDAAESLRTIRQQRMQLQEEETEAAFQVLMLMKHHDLKVYEYEGYRVELSATEKVKVRTKKEAENGEAEE